MPEKIDRPCPGVAVFHSTVNNSIRQPAGVEGQPEKAFGWQLARRGCVAFCPRNFLWPTNDMIAATAETERFQQRHPQSKGMAKMLYDAHLAIDLLAAMPEVDAHRLGAIGHSLGAKEVLYLAAFDERVKVTISSEGGIGTRFSNWDAGWYLGPTIKQPEFRREHHELLAMAAPRSFLLLGGDSADGDQSWPFITAALPVYRLYEGSPRVGLFNHRQGHSVPEAAEKRIAEWLDAYLLNA
jgi:pimeloyl-ACP methyl ester carboxylesterase